MPTVRTNDVDTFYDLRGAGPPVVFVHGITADHTAWSPQVDALSDDYATVAYDVRGHGRTGPSATPSYSFGLFAEDLARLLETLDVDRAVVCGLSMGGMIAQTYASTYPDRVAGLVLADTFTPRVLTPGDWLLRRVVLNAVVPPARLVGYERTSRLNAWLAERLSGGASGGGGTIRRLRESGPAMETDEFAKAIRAVTGFHEEGIDLSAITAPTLVLYGEDERPTLKHQGLELATRLPDVAVDEVPDAGHASNVDNPDYFTAAVRRFLSVHYPADGADASDGGGDEGAGTGPE